MKILLAISDEWTRDSLCHLLEKRVGSGMVEIITDGEALLRRVKARRSQLVVLDLLLEGMDGLAVLRAIRRLPAERQPEVMVVSSLRSRAVIAELAALQPSYYVTLPCEVKALADQVIGCCRERLYLHLESCTTAEQAVRVTLHALGIPARSKGWLYLQDGLLYLLSRPDEGISLTKILYPHIARRHRTTRSAVERAIRNAIAAAWEKDGLLWQDTLFPEGQPTNGEFLARVTNYLADAQTGVKEN